MSLLTISEQKSEFSLAMAWGTRRTRIGRIFILIFKAVASVSSVTSVPKYYSSWSFLTMLSFALKMLIFKAVWLQIRPSGVFARHGLGNAEDADRGIYAEDFFEYIKIICVRGQLRVESWEFRVSPPYSLTPYSSSPQYRHRQQSSSTVITSN